MTDLFVALSKSLVFWTAWIIIPLIMEIIPAIGGFFILVRKRYKKKKVDEVPAFFPQITLIIPVYNSEATLRACLASVNDSSYPNKMIEIMLVNNQSKDGSFAIFNECQNEYVDLSMQWLNAKQGKSKALNMALFNASGKYIIHIDSDGILHPDALSNMVTRFEQNSEIHCMTGSIMVDPKLVEATDGFFLRLLRRCEFYEYCQAFLAGRNYESELDSVFTLSGAFSAFRKSTILKTQLYNTDTVCEDTHVTFQVRKILKQKVHLCENALFFVDPIDDMNKMYTQRQRWQRGELEVFHIFFRNNMKVAKGFFSNFMIRLLVFDHTFAFPRMIWYFALICLMFVNYPFRLVAGSMGITYLLYIISGYLYFFNIVTYLKDYPELRHYYKSKWYICLIMPAYNFVIFWIRFAGIINSINNEGAWKTANLTEEREGFLQILKKDFSTVANIIERIRKAVNNEQQKTGGAE